VTALLVAVPALVVVGCMVLFVVGYRGLRGDPVDGLEVDDLVLLKDAKRNAAKGAGPISRLARPIGPLLVRAMGPALQARLKRMIELAGRPEGMTVETITQRMAVWVLIMAPLGVVLALQGQLLFAALTPVAVVVVPLAGVARARRLRQEQIGRDLPDFLDVLAVTVTAGVGFRAALDTVARRFGGPLSEEITLTLHQIRNGASVRDAFKRLRQRNDSEQLSTFVTAYLQAEELGAPLAVTLNRIALDMRRDSEQRQRQRAAKVVPRVTLVTSVVLLPGAIAVLGVGFVLGAELDFSQFSEIATP
jgi:tight adherence protein C